MTGCVRSFGLVKVPTKYPAKSNQAVLSGMKLAPIVLTAAEAQALERVAARGAHARERKRAQAVLSHSRGLTLSQLASAYAADRDTVRAWLTRFERGGAAALAEGPRAGRPRKLDPAAQKK